MGLCDLNVQSYSKFKTWFYSMRNSDAVLAKGSFKLIFSSFHFLIALSTYGAILQCAYEHLTGFVLSRRKSTISIFIDEFFLLKNMFFIVH